MSNRPTRPDHPTIEADVPHDIRVDPSSDLSQKEDRPSSPVTRPDPSDFLTVIERLRRDNARLTERVSDMTIERTALIEQIETLTAERDLLLSFKIDVAHLVEGERHASRPLRMFVGLDAAPLPDGDDEGLDVDMAGTER